jgi:hypothetical protein
LPLIKRQDSPIARVPMTNAELNMALYIAERKIIMVYGPVHV